MSYVHIIPDVNNPRKMQDGEDSADINDNKHRLKSFILKNEKTWNTFQVFIAPNTFSP